MERAGALAEDADVFFVIVSSCVVYPAAMLPQLSRGRIVVVNRGKVELPADNVVVTVDDDADRFFDQVWKEMEKG